MLKSFIKALVFVAGLAWAGMAGAVAFGSASIASALGQPLKVEISLTEVSDADRSSLVATLASPDAFKAAGLDYPYNLSKLKFEVVTRNGKTYIEVTSKEPVNDSFINLLVELNWNSGRLLREYTFLLDPPDYKAEQPKAEEVTPIEPAVAVVPPPEAPQVQPLASAASAPAAAEAAPMEAASAPAAVVPLTPETTAQAASAPEAAPAPGAEQVQAPPAAAPAAAPAAEVAPVPAASPATRETITVKRGDTLSKIAAQVKEPDLTLEQMLVALYRANVKQFDGKNMNRLRAGKILTVPEPESYEHLSNVEAVKVIRAQTASWHAYRQKLAAAVAAPAAEQAPKQEVTGKVSTAVTEKTPPAKEPANGKLVLSQGEQPGGKPAVTGKAPTPEVKAQQAREEAIAKEKATKENEQRAATLEKNVQDMKKLAEMKGSAPAAAPTAAASGVRPASGVHPARPKIAQAAPAPEPSLLDDILSNPIFDYLKDPMYLGIGVAVLLVLGGLGYYTVRRRREGGGGRKKKKLSSNP